MTRYITSTSVADVRSVVRSREEKYLAQTKNQSLMQYWSQKWNYSNQWVIPKAFKMVSGPNIQYSYGNI